jgi:hypothetical protein
MRQGKMGHIFAIRIKTFVLGAKHHHFNNTLATPHGRVMM